ncbi:MAG: protease [Chitinophagaceae bacterium]|nr:protease [Chitinophagaceae bacterium]
MRKILFPTGLVLACMTLFFACSKKDATPADSSAISQSTLQKIQALGFGTSNVLKTEEGYLVEGDINLTDELLNSKPSYSLLRVGDEEQYRTTNLVTGLPRVITVSLASKLPASYGPALDDMVARYNALGLRISFQHVSSGGNINFAVGHGSYLASSGFPTSTGQPYNQVLVNVSAIGSQPQATVASIFAHEVGHCIGFRHTDYMNRAYSCGGTATNEGASTIGAILVPGTPSGPDPNSWMLACIGSGQNRPFNANDQTALNYLYK